jgi:hypothetical protein
MFYFHSKYSNFQIKAELLLLGNKSDMATVLPFKKNPFLFHFIYVIYRQNQEFSSS